MSVYQTTLLGHITQADKQHNDYAYIPFELPQQARSLHVRYSYTDAMSSDQVQGGNVIDLGLFDPRGYGFPGGAGFRGWSGSARQEFTIALEQATPGYLPGPLPEGQYHVILGLYRIWPRGADYEIKIEAELTDQSFVHNEQPSTHIAQTPLVVEDNLPLTWLCGDLQSHTVHSDAKGTLEQLVGKARGIGLDFLAITDHNTVSHHPFLPELGDEELILIPGQEATTYYGHMNIWNTSRWCDFRCKTDVDMAAVTALAHASGGICSINHPKQGGPAWEYTTDLPVQMMEVWQGPWPNQNEESLALWESLLIKGRRLPAVGGSDYHCPSGEETNFLRLGQPTTWVKVSQRSIGGILAGLVAGQSCISATPQGPRLDLGASNRAGTATMGATLPPSEEGKVHVKVAIWDGSGRTLRVVADGESVYEQEVEADSVHVEVDLSVHTYVRAELFGDISATELPATAPPNLDLRNWRWALSNPIYISSTASTS